MRHNTPLFPCFWRSRHAAFISGRPRYSCVFFAPAGVNNSSRVLTLGSGFNAPTGVAVDGSGNVYVIDSLINDVKALI